MNAQQHTAILLFARSPESEARLKGFHPTSFRRSYQIAWQLRQHSLREARRSRLPVHHIGEQQQHGSSFGERLGNAIQEVFRMGYERLIIIGTDLPELSAGHILSAAAKLETNDWVLGPSRDGGTFLIGLHRRIFRYEAWLELPWLTDQAGQALVRYFQSNRASGDFLLPAADIDSTADLFQYLTQKRRFNRLDCILFSLLIAARIQPKPFKVDYFRSRVARLPQRGPPFLPGA